VKKIDVTENGKRADQTCRVCAQKEVQLGVSVLGRS